MHKRFRNTVEKKIVNQNRKNTDFQPLVWLEISFFNWETEKLKIINF
jgi:hypothetical protein